VPDPETPIAAGTPPEIVWLEHVRWTMDHFQRRLDAAGQAAWALAGLNGVFVALIAPIVGDFSGSAQVLSLQAMLAMTSAIFIIFFSATPRSIASINVESYRQLWKAHHSQKTVPGYSPSDPATAIVEESLQFHDQASPLVELVQLAEKRQRAIRWALLMTAVGAALLVVAVLASIIC